MKLLRNSSCLTFLLMAAILHSVTSDDPVCRVEERPSMGLSRLKETALVLSILDDARSSADCFRACCNYTDGRCNAVSYFHHGEVYSCVLLSCRPFESCVWMTSEKFTSARIQVTSVTDIALSPNNEQSLQTTPTVLMTSQKPTEVAEAVTTTQTASTSSETPASNSTGESIWNMEQPWNPESFPDAVKSSTASLQSTTVSKDAIWNMENPSEDNQPAETKETELHRNPEQESFENGEFSLNNQTEELSNNTQEAVDLVPNSSETNPDESWNIDSSIISQSVEANETKQTDDTLGNGLDVDTNGNDGHSITEEPWNIIESYDSSQIDDSHDNGQAAVDSENDFVQSTQSDSDEPDNSNNNDDDDNDNNNSDNYGQIDNSVEKDVYTSNDDEMENPDTLANDDVIENEQSDDRRNGFMFDGNDLEESVDDNGKAENPTDENQPQQPFEESFGHESNPEEEWKPVNVEGPSSLIPPGQYSPEEEETAISRPMKPLLIQTPGIIIGLCSALGVAFLVLVAVCKKIYTSQDGPRYKPLRDYDIRFEPPAASSALLP